MTKKKEVSTNENWEWIFDDSHVDEIHEKIANGEFTTPEELIAFLKSMHDLD